MEYFLSIHLKYKQKLRESQISRSIHKDFIELKILYIDKAKKLAKMIYTIYLDGSNTN